MAAVLRIKARAARPVRDPSGKDAPVTTAIDAVAEPVGIAGDSLHQNEHARRRDHRQRVRSRNLLLSTGRAVQEEGEPSTQKSHVRGRSGARPGTRIPPGMPWDWKETNQ